MSVGRVLVTPLIWLIRAYQRLISPMRPATCRYYPSCSAYAVTALERFGPLRGSWMALTTRTHPAHCDHVTSVTPPTPAAAGTL